MLLKVLTFTLLNTIIMKTGAFFTDNSVIVNLNNENFKKLVNTGKEMWVVEFYAPWCGQCKLFSDEYVKAGKAFEGIIKFGAVNADENTELVQEYDVRGYPAIKLFNGHKGTPELYDGERKLRSLVSFLEVEIHSTINSRLDGNLDPSMFKSKEIFELTENNFENVVLKSKGMWLIVFYSPFSEQCKDLSTHWLKVTKEIKGVVKLGAVDATANFAVAANCKIEGYPTIQFFPPGKKTITSGINYHGDGEAGAIIKWSLGKVSENAPTPKIVQIIDIDSLQNACDKRPVCIVSILPSIFDCQADCRNDFLEMLSSISQKYKESLWGWVWSEAGAQPEIEAALEIEGGMYPVMAAVNVKKLKFSLLSEGFSFEEIDHFLSNLSFDHKNTKSLKVKEVPDIKKIQPWDGLNAEMPSFSDEFPEYVFDARDEL